MAEKGESSKGKQNEEGNDCQELKTDEGNQEEICKGKQNENKKEAAQKNEVKANEAHNNYVSQSPNEVQKEEPSTAYVQNKEKGRKKKKKTMPKKRSSVMFKPVVKKNRKKATTIATGGNTIATNEVIEDSLKELGVLENNKSLNIVNIQKVTSNAKSDTIEKVDESNPSEGENTNDNKEEGNQQIEIDRTGNNSTKQCHDSESVNMGEPSSNQKSSNTKSESLPSKIKKHPGIQVLVDLGGYNIEEKKIQNHGKMIEEVTGNSNMSISDNSNETLNKQRDDPAEAHLKEVSNRQGISPVKRGRSRNRKNGKNKEKVNLSSRGRSQS